MKAMVMHAAGEELVLAPEIPVRTRITTYALEEVNTALDD